MYYEENQLKSILTCPKCSLKFREPKVLPCGYLVCTSCVSEIHQLVSSLDTSEFYCQSCTEFHDLAESTQFPTCQPILNLLATEEPIDLNRAPILQLSQLEAALFSRNFIGDEMELVSEYCLKLRTDLMQLFNDSVAKIHMLKDALLSKIDQYHKDCEKSFMQIKKFDYDSNLNELQTLHSKWQKAVDSIELTDYELNKINEMTNVFVNKLNTKKKEFRAFILENEFISPYSHGLNEISNNLLEYTAKYLTTSGTNNLRLVNELIGHMDSVYSVVVLSDYKIASGSADGVIRIWDGLTGLLENTICIHSSSINSLIGLSKNRIASGSWDNTIKITNTNNGKCLQTLTGHSGVIYALELLEDEFFASGSYDGSIKIWNSSKVNASCSPKLTINGNSGGVYCLAALPASRLASGFQDGIKIWNVHSGELLSAIAGHSDAVNAIVRLSDTEFASGSWDQTIMIWDADTGDLKMTLIGHSDEVTSLVKLPNGDLASGSMDGFLRVWNCKTGELKSEANKKSSSLYKLCMLPNGQIVSGWEDRTVKIHGFTSE